MAVSKGDNKQWADAGHNDADWKTVTTTKTLEDQGYGNFEGFGWYRKKVVLPDSITRALPANGYLVVSYRQVDDCDELYFNGHFIGRTGGFPPSYVSAYSEPREYRVPVKYVYQRDQIPLLFAFTTGVGAPEYYRRM
jgi:hypothetical protein